jgi:hypothetical protein
MMDTLRQAWAGIWGRITGEPVLTLAIIQMLVALLVSFGLNWTADQVGAVVAFSAALLGWLARRVVTPIDTPSLAEGTRVEVVTPEGRPNTVTVL